ncbi:MAG: FAD-linked oxidase C-terminal domain-containing protein [Aeromicrobium sp.]
MTQMTPTTPGADFLAALGEALPGLTVQTGVDTMMSHAQDHALFTEVGVPLAVVFPTETAQVSTICALATRHRIPVVPRGAGTGLSGGANAVEGGVVLCVERMDRVLDIDVDNAVAVVQPGVINAALSRQVKEVGLFYPPDPGSQDISSIGGNVATNAGGLCCVKYGVTRDYVIGMEVVLADGRITRLGRRSRKGVAGLDLTGLFIGSEGTLGVVTEVTLRLLRAPGEARSTMVAEFDSLAAAGLAVQQIVTTTAPAMLEIMDASSLDAVRRWKNIEFSPGVAAVLIAQSDAFDAQTRVREVELMQQAAEVSSATSVFVSDDVAEGDALVAVRRMAGPAMEQLGTVLVDDVAVPISRLVDFLTGCQAIGSRLGAHVAIIGHAGDGNMHPSIIFDAADAEQARIAHDTFEQIGLLGLQLGGTITGEHGVGLLKAGLLETELGEVALDMHRAIKHALDPLSLMNPGKVFALPTPAPGVDEGRDTTTQGEAR